MLTDAQARPQGLSPARPLPPSFANALCQNIASGNTMAFNAAALHLLQRQSHTARDLPFHDWWAYQLISGTTGQVIHDDIPSLLYRQHATNAVGAATGLSGMYRRILRVTGQRLSMDVDKHLTALMASKHMLTPDNLRLLASVIGARRKGTFGRLTGTIGARLYRHTLAGTLGLWASAALGRF